MVSETTRHSWSRAWSVYADRRVVSILFLGFASGLPLALTFGTLTVWLAEAGINKTTIGLFALTGLPYTFKFAWAPLVDTLDLPWLCRRFGRRRGWILGIQMLLMGAVLALGMTNPVATPWLMGALALIVAFASASQDIVIDAYRVEILEEHQLGAGAAVIVLGYRIGMLVSGAGALYLADFFGWATAYLVMAACVGIGMLTVLLIAEPAAAAHGQRPELSAAPPLQRLLHWIENAVLGPFTDFMRRRGWWLILLFILLYKLGDAVAGVMSNPFYIELGFSKTDIANISKAFGLGATIIGGIVGGLLVSRYGILRSLIICGLLQMASNLMFVLLAWTGRDIGVLTLTIAVENLSGGMGTAAFVAYLSSLCHVAYTATQYALLSSFMAFGRTLLASSSGWFAEQLDWISFFLLSTLAALPGVLLLFLLGRLLSGHEAPTEPPP